MDGMDEVDEVDEVDQRDGRGNWRFEISKGVMGNGQWANGGGQAKAGGG